MVPRNIQVRPWTDAVRRARLRRPRRGERGGGGRTRRRGRVRFQTPARKPLGRGHAGGRRARFESVQRGRVRCGFGERRPRRRRGGGDRRAGHRRNISAASAGSGGFLHDGVRGDGARAGLGTSARRPRRRRAYSGGSSDGISSGYTRGRSKTAGNEEELLEGGKHRKTSSAGGVRSPVRSVASPLRSHTPSKALVLEF